MTSFLMGVIKRGTAKNINNFSYQIAGKTGTTNENQDAWFIGYNSEITVGVFVGYDEPKSLGKFETGSRVAAPIFRDFMDKSYIETSPIPFNIPDSISLLTLIYSLGNQVIKFLLQNLLNIILTLMIILILKLMNQIMNLRAFTNEI